MKAKEQIGEYQFEELLKFLCENYFRADYLRGPIYEELEKNMVYLGYGMWATHESWYGRVWVLSCEGGTGKTTECAIHSIGHESKDGKKNYRIKFKIIKFEKTGQITTRKANAHPTKN